MNNFFCADYSRQIGEDIIGSATNYQTYILVECPPPWASEAFHSKWIPENLRFLVEEVKSAKLPVSFLLIANDLSHKINHTTLLIYQKQEGLSSGYDKQEFHLTNIEQVAGVVRKYLCGKNPGYEVKNIVTRDILICTHGSHDQCCARYGNPFYFHAKNTITNLHLENTRIWKSTHFGGHRFAPTAIDLPEGRYYGVLDSESFRAILTRTGDIQCLNQVYRGSGILPPALQILEKELILYYGWDWFNYKISGKILEQSLDNQTILGELTFEQPAGVLYTYQAKLLKDEANSPHLKTACNAKQYSLIVKYGIASLGVVSKKIATYSV